MSKDQDKINELLRKLEALINKQEEFSKEIKVLQEDLNQLQQSQIAKPKVKESLTAQTKATPENLFTEKGSDETKPLYNQTHANKITRDASRKIFGGVCAGIAKYYNVNLFLIRTICIILSLLFCIGVLIYVLLWIIIPEEKRFYEHPKSAPITPQESVKRSFVTPNKNLSKTNWEKFIGENLINKIGIIIIIIGVAIGTKYTIDNDLLSPLSRIILGYLVGIALLGFGIQLKKKYDNFSAVLVSGAITILYFITYIAYSFYNLFPQFTAFILMVLFTIFATIAALNYNKQIIAHIGLVGAYAVPFLLSDNSGNALVLFSYMSIINIGILVIAFKKYWKALYISSFVITWLIFASWYTEVYNAVEHFRMALAFNSIFFVIFYTTFLAFKLLQKEKFEISDILLLLANSFVFYGFGYGIIDSHNSATQFLGLFTLANALLHFIVSTIIYKQKLGDRNLFYMVSGLVLVFITIAVPVQLDGNWVTLLWVGEATLLFWIGRTKHMAIYEYLSYALMILAILSIYQDWSVGYARYTNTESIVKPILNSYFLTSVLFICAFALIYKFHTNQNYKSPLKKEWLKLVSFLLPAVLISSLYLVFRFELEHFWQLMFNDSRIVITDYEQYNNSDLLKFKTIWVINYSLLFVSMLSFINMKTIKNRLLGLINLSLNICAVMVFLVQGLYVLSDLRMSYLEQSLSEYYQIGFFNIGIRYISLVFVVLTILACYKYSRQEFMKINFKMGFDLLLYTTVLWIMSSELIHLLDMANSNDSYKLGLSILWGTYSLLLISIGIWKSKKHLRVGAIVIFSITLIKLFFYDISHLNTISKTIVFLSLGVLLLIISFLYNKFKHKITDDSEI